MPPENGRKSGAGAGVGIALVIAVSSAILGYYSTLLLWEDIRPWRIYKLSFKKTQGLEKKDSVFCFGMRVGRVHAIGLEGDHQLALIQVDPSVTIFREDARVEIVRTDAFGTVAVFIDPGNPKSGPWPPDLAFEGKFQEALTAGADDSSSPTALIEFFHTFDESTSELTRPDGSSLGRLLNDHDLARSVKDGFAQTSRTFTSARDAIARIASNEGPGGLIAPEPALVVGDAAQAAHEGLEQTLDSLRETARGENGLLGRLLGDGDARSTARAQLEGWSEILEGYRNAEGRYAGLFAHAPESSERVLMLLDGLSSGTDRALHDEGTAGALFGMHSGVGVREAVNGMATRLDAGRHADASAGDILSDDPAGKRELQDYASRFDDVLQDMRRALARIRTSQSANTFHGALFSVF